MELSSWQCYGFIIYTLTISCVAKPFSLNEAIAAESRTNQVLETSSAELPEISDKLFARHKAFRREEKPQKFKISGLTDTIAALRNKNPLKYKKAFQIKSPFKSKHLKSKLGLLRRNQAVKRHTNDDDKYNDEYIPLFKNLGLLVDSLLTADTSNESNVKKPRRQYKRNRHFAEERDGIVCSCAHKSDLHVEESRQRQKAIATTTPKITAAPKTTTETTDYITISDFGSIRQNTDDTILSTRNTTSRRRNNYGHYERSNATFHRSNQRYNTRDHGNSKYNTREQRLETSSEDNEEHTTGDTRNRASDGFGGIRGITHYPGNTANRTEPPEEIELEKNETNKYLRREIKQPKRQNKLEVGRDETEVATILPEHVRGAGNFIPEGPIGVFTDPISSKETDEDGFDNIASDKRLTKTNGAVSSQNKKAGESNEAVVIHNVPDQHRYLNSATKSKPIVMIIDGYSIARDKNGKQKYAENKIRIQP